MMTEIICPVCNGTPTHYGLYDPAVFDYWIAMRDEDNAQVYDCEYCGETHADCLVCDWCSVLYVEDNE